MTHIRIIFLICALAWQGSARGEKLRVVSLHPFLSEITRILCSNEVEVIELLGPEADPHRFDPTPRDLARVQNANLILAMGKNLEHYLDRVTAAIEGDVRVIEAGRTVPSILIDTEQETFACCPNHAHGAIDPHWWHDVDAMRRAVRSLEKEFRKELPDQATMIKARSRDYQAKLRTLDEWVEHRVSIVPKANRKLVTAHAGFGYFCVAYGFQAIPVKGLAGRREPSQDHIAQTIEIIRKEQVTAVFPELHASSNVLKLIQRETGAQIAGALLADNAGAGGLSYEAFVRANVKTILTALAPSR